MIIINTILEDAFIYLFFNNSQSPNKQQITFNFNYGAVQIECSKYCTSILRLQKKYTNKVRLN